MTYASAHKLSSGRICLSINTVESDSHANLTLFSVTPAMLREWAENLEAVIREKEIEDRVKAAIAAESSHD